MSRLRNSTKDKLDGEQQPKQTDTQRLAEERTDWAYERTVLAKERTYSAWVRTGLAAVAAGLGITRLLARGAPELEPRWAIYLLGALLVSTGVIIFALSFWRYHQPIRDDQNVPGHGTPTWLIAVLTVALMFAAGLGLWLLL